MAQTVIDASARVTQWDDRFFMEYVRANRFARYMGTDENSVVQVNERLGARKGDEIRCTLVGALRGTRNNGTTALVGNEKALQNYAWGTKVRTVRDATTVDMDEQQASPIDIRQASRVALRDLSLQYIRDDIIGSLADHTGSPNVGNSETGTMTDDQWDAANADRILYGATASTGAGMQAQINAIAANTTASADVLVAAATAAKTTGLGVGATNDKDAPNKIRPIKTAEDEEWYVWFVGTKDYNNLQNDSVIQAANYEAWQRYGGSAKTGGSGTNPLYRAGDLVYRGVIVREISEIDDLTQLSGTTPGDVQQSFMCGAQSVHAAWAQRTRTTLKKEDDYGYQYGVGFSELRGISKNWWAREAGSTALRQWGVVSVFTAAA